MNYGTYGPIFYGCIKKKLRCDSLLFRYRYLCRTYAYQVFACTHTCCTSTYCHPGRTTLRRYALRSDSFQVYSTCLKAY